MNEEDNDDDLWKPRGLPYAETGTTRKREQSFDFGGTFKREPSFGYSSWEIAFRNKKKARNR